MEEKESVNPKTKPDSFLKRSWRGIKRLVLVGLGAFVIGGLLVFLTLFKPVQQNLELADTNLEQANEKINTQADLINTLEEENETLQTNFDSARLHSDLLEALSGARGASLAVAADDYAGARLLLINASEALNSLSGRVGVDQKDVLAAMQQSAEQVLDSMQNNLKSAQQELDQLVNNLVQLEENLFPSP